MTSKCGFNPFSWFQTQTVTKDKKTYHIETVSTERANKIAKKNFDLRVEDHNRRYSTNGKKAVPIDSHSGE